VLAEVATNTELSNLHEFIFGHEHHRDKWVKNMAGIWEEE